MNKHEFIITKASGEKVPFSKKKLLESLQRAGASKKQALEIANEVEGKIYDGILTKKIYSLAFSLLRGRSRHLAARYHLKAGIMELGPSGYPFEKYIAEILRHLNYETKVGQIVQGHCVTHEVDVVAEKGDQHFMVECKYHNSQGIACDVKIPLYIQARFKDIEQQWQQIPGHTLKFHQGWLVTNTRFTGDALQYGTCCGLHLISWDYPRKGGLKDLVDSLGLYPLTCLTSLSNSEKTELLNKGLVLARTLHEHQDALVQIGISASRIKLVVEESKLLCQKSQE